MLTRLKMDVWQPPDDNMTAEVRRQVGDPAYHQVSSKTYSEVYTQGLSKGWASREGHPVFIINLRKIFDEIQDQVAGLVWRPLLQDMQKQVNAN